MKDYTKEIRQIKDFITKLGYVKTLENEYTILPKKGTLFTGDIIGIRYIFMKRKLRHEVKYYQGPLSKNEKWHITFCCPYEKVIIVNNKIEVPDEYYADEK